MLHLQRSTISDIENIEYILKKKDYSGIKTNQDIKKIFKDLGSAFRIFGESLKKIHNDGNTIICNIKKKKESDKEKLDENVYLVDCFTNVISVIKHMYEENISASEEIEKNIVDEFEKEEKERIEDINDIYKEETNLKDNIENEDSDNYNNDNYNNDNFNNDNYNNDNINNDNFNNDNFNNDNIYNDLSIDEYVKNDVCIENIPIIHLDNYLKKCLEKSEFTNEYVNHPKYANYFSEFSKLDLKLEKEIHSFKEIIGKFAKNASKHLINKSHERIQAIYIKKKEILSFLYENIDELKLNKNNIICNKDISFNKHQNEEKKKKKNVNFENKSGKTYDKLSYKKKKRNNKIQDQSLYLEKFEIREKYRIEKIYSSFRTFIKLLALKHIRINKVIYETSKEISSYDSLIDYQQWLSIILKKNIDIGNLQECIQNNNILSKEEEFMLMPSETNNSPNTYIMNLLEKVQYSAPHFLKGELIFNENKKEKLKIQEDHDNKKNKENDISFEKNENTIKIDQDDMINTQLNDNKNDSTPILSREEKCNFEKNVNKSEGINSHRDSQFPDIFYIPIIIKQNDIDEIKSVCHNVNDQEHYNDHINSCVTNKYVNKGIDGHEDIYIDKILYNNINYCSNLNMNIYFKKDMDRYNGNNIVTFYKNRQKCYEKYLLQFNDLNMLSYIYKNKNIKTDNNDNYIHNNIIDDSSILFDNKNFQSFFYEESHNFYPYKIPSCISNNFSIFQKINSHNNNESYNMEEYDIDENDYKLMSYESLLLVYYFLSTQLNCYFLYDIGSQNKINKYMYKEICDKYSDTLNALFRNDESYLNKEDIKKVDDKKNILSLPTDSYEKEKFEKYQKYEKYEKYIKCNNNNNTENVKKKDKKINDYFEYIDYIYNVKLQNLLLIKRLISIFRNKLYLNSRNNDLITMLTIPNHYMNYGYKYSFHVLDIRFRLMRLLESLQYNDLFDCNDQNGLSKEGDKNNKKNNHNNNNNNNNKYNSNSNNPLYIYLSWVRRQLHLLYMSLYFKFKRFMIFIPYFYNIYKIYNNNIMSDEEEYDIFKGNENYFTYTNKCKDENNSFVRYIKNVEKKIKKIHYFILSQKGNVNYNMQHIMNENIINDDNNVHYINFSCLNSDEKIVFFSYLLLKNLIKSFRIVLLLKSLIKENIWNKGKVDEKLKLTNLIKYFTKIECYDNEIKNVIYNSFSNPHMSNMDHNDDNIKNTSIEVEEKYKFETMKSEDSSIIYTTNNNMCGINNMCVTSNIYDTSKRDYNKYICNNNINVCYNNMSNSFEYNKLYVDSSKKNVKNEEQNVYDKEQNKNENTHICKSIDNDELFKNIFLNECIIKKKKNIKKRVFYKLNVETVLSSSWFLDRILIHLFLYFYTSCMIDKNSKEKIFFDAPYIMQGIIMVIHYLLAGNDLTLRNQKKTNINKEYIKESETVYNKYKEAASTNMTHMTNNNNNNNINSCSNIYGDPYKQYDIQSIYNTYNDGLESTLIPMNTFILYFVIHLFYSFFDKNTLTLYNNNEYKTYELFLKKQSHENKKENTLDDLLNQSSANNMTNEIITVQMASRFFFLIKNFEQFLSSRSIDENNTFANNTKKRTSVKNIKLKKHELYSDNGDNDYSCTDKHLKNKKNKKYLHEHNNNNTNQNYIYDKEEKKKMKKKKKKKKKNLFCSNVPEGTNNSFNDPFIMDEKFVKDIETKKIKEEEYKNDIIYLRRYYNIKKFFNYDHFENLISCYVPNIFSYYLNEHIFSKDYILFDRITLNNEIYMIDDNKKSIMCDKDEKKEIHFKVSNNIYDEEASYENTRNSYYFMCGSLKKENYKRKTNEYIDIKNYNNNKENYFNSSNSSSNSTNNWSSSISSSSSNSSDSINSNKKKLNYNNNNDYHYNNFNDDVYNNIEKNNNLTSNCNNLIIKYKNNNELSYISLIEISRIEKVMIDIFLMRILSCDFRNYFFLIFCNYRKFIDMYSLPYMLDVFIMLNKFFTINNNNIIDKCNNNNMFNIYNECSSGGEGENPKKKKKKESNQDVDMINSLERINIHKHKKEQENNRKISGFELFCNIQIDDQQNNKINVKGGDEKKEDNIQLEHINSIEKTEESDIYKIKHNNTNNIEKEMYNKYICGEQFNKHKYMYIDCMNDAMKYVEKENNKINMDENRNNKKNEKFDKNKDLNNGDILYMNTFDVHGNSNLSGYEKLSTYFKYFIFSSAKNIFYNILCGIKDDIALKDTYVDEENILIHENNGNNILNRINTNGDCKEMINSQKCSDGYHHGDDMMNVQNDNTNKDNIEKNICDDKKKKKKKKFCNVIISNAMLNEYVNIINKYINEIIMEILFFTNIWKHYLSLEEHPRIVLFAANKTLYYEVLKFIKNNKKKTDEESFKQSLSIIVSLYNFNLLNKEIVLQTYTYETRHIIKNDVLKKNSSILLNDEHNKYYYMGSKSVHEYKLRNGSKVFNEKIKTKILNYYENRNSVRFNINENINNNIEKEIDNKEKNKIDKIDLSLNDNKNNSVCNIKENSNEDDMFINLSLIISNSNDPYMVKLMFKLEKIFIKFIDKKLQENKNLLSECLKNEKLIPLNAPDIMYNSTTVDIFTIISHILEALFEYKCPVEWIITPFLEFLNNFINDYCENYKKRYTSFIISVLNQYADKYFNDLLNLNEQQKIQWNKYSTDNKKKKYKKKENHDTNVKENLTIFKKNDHDLTQNNQDIEEDQEEEIFDDNIHEEYKDAHEITKRIRHKNKKKTNVFYKLFDYEEIDSIIKNKIDEILTDKNDESISKTSNNNLQQNMNHNNINHYKKNTKKKNHKVPENGNDAPTTNDDYDNHSENKNKTDGSYMSDDLINIIDEINFLFNDSDLSNSLVITWNLYFFSEQLPLIKKKFEKYILQYVCTRTKNVETISQIFDEQLYFNITQDKLQTNFYTKTIFDVLDMSINNIKNTLNNTLYFIFKVLSIRIICYEFQKEIFYNLYEPFHINNIQSIVSIFPNTIEKFFKQLPKIYFKSILTVFIELFIKMWMLVIIEKGFSNYHFSDQHIHIMKKDNQFLKLYLENNQIESTHNFLSKKYHINEYIDTFLDSLYGNRDMFEEILNEHKHKKHKNIVSSAYSKGMAIISGVNQHIQEKTKWME
ncbi:conserved Plasmodium protein, unknown function [Plasmodium sp. gorilla clade G2]|uniref:conserved Plasmodium protein, unknown function n=1 Tax=Plasmodium sp. gorilla clade G2 TaxID=880535 RepID=UPI000D222F05|nr:conserved Plasmodium protein, unknown function [Plasmodium sp. gorilla clade G2]SOV18253.1 conserved Plasmodium protein, unknown function [Plasmodium sp. gorilla clade G2]